MLTASRYRCGVSEAWVITRRRTALRRFYDVSSVPGHLRTMVGIRIHCLEVLARSAPLGGYETAEVILAPLGESGSVEGDGEGAK